MCLYQVPICTAISADDFVDIREWKAELLEPRSGNCEDFVKFVSSLALSVHVAASLSHVTDHTHIAIQVKQ